MNRSLPSVATVIGTIAGVTLKRVMRGALLWVTVGLALLPALYGVLASKTESNLDNAAQAAFSMELLLLAVAAAMIVAWPVGEEIDDRSATYLWSRPFPRWTILAGKLAALTPVVVAMFVLGWTAVIAATTKTFTVAPYASLVAGAVAASLAAAGMAMVLPKHPFAIALLVLGVLDQPIGAMPSSIHFIAISHHVRVLAGYSSGDTSSSIIGLVVLAAAWTWVALWRIHKTQL